MAFCLKRHFELRCARPASGTVAEVVVIVIVIITIIIIAVADNAAVVVAIVIVIEQYKIKQGIQNRGKKAQR